MGSALEQRARARVGSTLRGKYRLDRLLGVGGMAVVYAATHRNNKNRVAIKMLHHELSLNAEVRARFLREGYVANSVEHPGAVRVIDDDVTDDGEVFIVMDLLEGETLGKRLQRCGGTIAPPEAASIAIALLDTLAAAHGKGIVHRDIKPDNLFVTSRGDVKVLDFGIARLREGRPGESSTQTGQMVGTPAFMAPEQALGHSEEIGPHTDIWAVGATMFAMMTGQFVHPARTNNEVVVFAATRPARALRTVSPDVPEAIAAAVDRALAFAKADRWPDAKAMKAALEAACPGKCSIPPAPAPTTSEKMALDDSDLRWRTELADNGQASSSPAVVRVSSRPNRMDVSPAMSPAAMSVDDVLGPTVASGAEPAKPTTTMGVSSEGRPAPRRARGAARARIAVVVACVAAIAAAGGVVAMRPRGEEAPRAAGSLPSASTPSTSPSTATATATATQAPAHSAKPPRVAPPATKSSPPPPPVNPLDRQ